MSDASTTQLIGMYMEEATAPMFLSGFFQSPPRNFHSSEKVEIDIERDDEQVAIVITDVSAGARMNESTLYTNKGFVPPIFDEAGAIKAYSLMKRQPGVDPFQSPDYGANAVREAFRIFRKLERKIRRAIELMGSQVLQTGTLTLTDATGAPLYVLSFDPKDTHFPTVGTSWGSTGAKPLEDIESLADVVRRDGKREPRQLIYGMRAYRRFVSDETVAALLDNRRIEMGALVRPQARGQGAKFRGWLAIGHYDYEVWTYDGFYVDPVTGETKPYVHPDSVIMLSEGGRLDLSYGAIPMVAEPDPRAMPFLPPRMSSGERGLDLSVNAWITPDNKQLMVSAGTRPLTIPTAIDTFGCLTTDDGDS